MTQYSLPYGPATLTFEIPDRFNVETLLPDQVQPLTDPEGAVREALRNPLGSENLAKLNQVTSIGIAINDKTRPIPNPDPIPLLLQHLEDLGFDPGSITLFIGSGTHTPMSDAELKTHLGGGIVDRYPIVVHDCDHSPLADLGTTPYQTPFKINADFYHCDLKISVGNIEPHHFMGFSGGVKTAVIGLAGRETINTNHAMLSHPQAKSGVFHSNPMRQDIEAMGRMADVNFSLGTILDEEKRILKVLFGSPLAVIEAAIPVIQQQFGVLAPEPYDLVIASPGGAPKDINLYQAQKGLTHAARITRDGGWVVLLAACPEGSGSPSFEDYVTRATSHQDIITHFNSGFFEVGPHKAFQIAKEAVRVNIVLVSDIPPEDVKGWKITPSQPERLSHLIQWLTGRLPADARIAILPAATRTMAESHK